MKTANELLHELIREQNKALYRLVQSVKDNVLEQDLGPKFSKALDNAEALCQKPPGDENEKG